MPGPSQVMTVAALANYIQGHATTIRSEADAIRAADLAKQYLETHVKNPMAPGVVLDTIAPARIFQMAAGHVRP